MTETDIQTLADLKKSMAQQERGGYGYLIPSDMLEDIKRCLRGTQVGAEMPVACGGICS